MVSQFDDIAEKKPPPGHASNLGARRWSLGHDAALSRRIPAVVRKPAGRGAAYPFRTLAHSPNGSTSSLSKFAPNRRSLRAERPRERMAPGAHFLLHPSLPPAPLHLLPCPP